MPGKHFVGEVPKSEAGDIGLHNCFAADNSIIVGQATGVNSVVYDLGRCLVVVSCCAQLFPLQSSAMIIFLSTQAEIGRRIPQKANINTAAPFLSCLASPREECGHCMAFIYHMNGVHIMSHSHYGGSSAVCTIHSSGTNVSFL